MSSYFFEHAEKSEIQLSREFSPLKMEKEKKKTAGIFFFQWQKRSNKTF